MRIWIVSLMMCLPVLPANAQYSGDSGTTGCLATRAYVFLGDQSTVVQTGGIAGIHRTYSVTGRFRLAVDCQTASASFVNVDANAVNTAPPSVTIDPNAVFNLAGLTGTEITSGTYVFDGQVADGSRVQITLALEDGSARMFGQTTPPPNTADFFVFSLDATVQRKYSAGSGTADAPYQIATAEDLIALGETPDDYDKHFILTADIDLDPNLAGRKVFRAALIAPEPNLVDWFQETPFTGVFEGNHHAISHLTIEGKQYLGLFGLLGDGALIANLGLEAVDVNGTDTSVGGLAGAINFGGSITGCWSSGIVTGRAAVGGLVGGNLSWRDHSTVTGCYSTATVQGISLVGGLAGLNEGTVSDCYSAGVIGGEDCVGGLVGQNGEPWEDARNRGLILRCYSTAQVDGGDRVGGLVGENWDKLFDCHSTGAVTGVNQVGGLIGCTQCYFGDEGAVQCYSTSSVTGSDAVGGLVGVNVNELVQCYSTGPVTGKHNVGGLVGENGLSITDSYATSSVDGMANVGGLVGYQIRGSSVDGCYSTGMVNGFESVGGLVGSYQTGSVMASFWDIETSGQAESGGGIGLTTAEMQTASTFLEAGWDFINETENGLNGIWEIIEGQAYPLLSWRRYGGGTGEPNNPYLIYTAEHLNAFGAEPNDYDKHFKLMADIDLSEYTFDGAVIGPDVDPRSPDFQGLLFTGVFDGNGHVISHLTIVGDSYLGLFGQLGPEAQVSNLGLEALDISGTGEHVGGLVGRNRGCISTSYSAGTITGCGGVGGLVGTNVGAIEESYATARVSGAVSVGGLVGKNFGSVRADGHRVPVVPPRGSLTHCYSAGMVSATVGCVGGLVGFSLEQGVTACFWDIQWSGQSTSDGGTGLPTAAMQGVGVFLDAGWDFVDETENGTDDIWWIPEGQDYPRLTWELADGISEE